MLTGMYPLLDIRRVASLEQESVETTEQEGNGDVQQVQENGGTIAEKTPPQQHNREDDPLEAVLNNIMLANPNKKNNKTRVRGFLSETKAFKDQHSTSACDGEERSKFIF